MKDKIWIGFVVLMLAGSTAGFKVDSISLDPTHIEPGDETKVTVKFNTKLQSVKGEIIVSGRFEYKSELYHIAELVSDDDLSREYLIIREGVREIGYLSAGETWSPVFKVKVREDAPTGEYKLKFLLREKDASNIIFIHEFTFQVTGVTRLEVNLTEKALQPGSTNSVRIGVDNVGSGIARYVKTILKSTEFIKVVGSQVQHLGTVNPEKTGGAGYEIYVDNEAEAGVYEVPLHLEFIDFTGGLEKQILI